ncbi:dihydroorotate dehydrogenase electron transfer subunit [Adlercreutzia sp. ZJ138]|uniref:dihydroorotate dehydrogenase electron transfer subunit n=1 Tax=Adlercreutzia sp. ZJ138 TaxID=2709405 RepID=UPI0013EC7A14|nr:dihydroorotate dehydrogenase electron transfer subunit [Adlercreutzia sp. ZJ138]
MALVNECARVVSNEQLAAKLYLMRVESSEIARSILPGQFVHMKIAGMDDHILRRPFSVYARNAEEGTFDVLYQVVGTGSARMTDMATGANCEFIGPIGTPWQPPTGTHRALVVGGGVGAAPVFMLCEHLLASDVDLTVVLGAATRDALVCKDRYEALLGHEPRCATDDGTYGRAGFCTSLVEEALEEANAAGQPYDYVAVCGPEPLMRIVARMAADANVHCQVSMERRMACGVGACLSCVVETVDGRRRSCVDGPVFDARKVVWA